MKRFRSVHKSLAVAALVGLTTTAPAQAQDAAQAVLGALVGAGSGAALGHIMGGRDGAVVGGALGAVVGTVAASRPSYSVQGSHGGYGGYAPQRVWYPPPPPVYVPAPAYPAMVTYPAPYYQAPAVVYRHRQWCDDPPYYRRFYRPDPVYRSAPDWYPPDYEGRRWHRW